MCVGNESAQSLQPITVSSVSIASTHAAVVLANAYTDPLTGAAFGNDVYLLGHNDAYQLGTGKRSNLCIPQHIPPLPYPSTTTTTTAIVGMEDEGKKKSEESTLQSGTTSHMPHNRLQLCPKRQGSKMEERITAGYGNTIVWWKQSD